MQNHELRLQHIQRSTRKLLRNHTLQRWFRIFASNVENQLEEFVGDILLGKSLQGMPQFSHLENH
jgi:hypothetical protein